MGWTNETKGWMSKHEDSLKLVGALGVGIVGGVLIREYAPKIQEKYGITNLQERLLNKMPYAKKEDIDTRIDELTKKIDNYMHGAGQ